MNILKKILFFFIGVPVLSFFLLITLSNWSQMQSDSKVDKLEIVEWEGLLPINITVPVCYVDKVGIFTKSSTMRTNKGEDYSFRVDPDHPDRYWITRMRFMFGGKYWVRYRITDSAVEKQLAELYRTKPFEVLLEQKRQQELK